MTTRLSEGTMLSKYGYRVIETESPSEAIQYVRQTGQPIHLPLTDIVMPRTNGFELAKSIRAGTPAFAWPLLLAKRGRRIDPQRAHRRRQRRQHRHQH